MENTAGEIKRLQSCINDLISVLALPALWGGSGSSQMVGTLLDVLLAMLRLDLAYARLSDASDGPPIEVIRLGHRHHPSVQPQQIGQALGRLLTGDQAASRFVVPDPAGEVEVSIASFSLGLQHEVGVLVAGSRRADFPTEVERLLLRVAANQAEIGLQEARRSGEQKRVAEALEQRVTERTRQLTAVNEDLRRSEAYLAEAQRLSHTGSFGWRVSTGEILWSEETFRIFKYDRTTKPTVELVLHRVHPEDAVLVKETFERASHDGKDFDHECRLVMPDGSVKYVHVVAHALNGESGSIEFVGAVIDVTERKRSDMLLAGEKRLLEMIARGDSRTLIFDALCRLVEELASGALSSILLLDPNANRLRHGAAPSLPTEYVEAIDGAVIGPSAGSCGTAAYRAETVIVSDIATDPLWADYRDLALAHGLRACWSTPILSLDGKVLGTFATYYREPRSPTGQEQSFMEQVTHLASIALEREQAGGVLREQANLLDLTHDTVFVRDMSDVITYWNRGAEERYGWTRQEALGKVSHQLMQTIFPVPLEEINAELLRVDHWEGELVHIHRDGTPVVVASRWALRKDEARKPVAILETNNDITERKRWRSLTEALPQLVWAASPDGACDYFSTQWTEYTGVPEADLLGWRWMDVLHPDDRENTRKFWADSVAGRRPYDVEYRVRRHDGAYGWFKTRGTPIRDSAGRIIKWFGTCTDITESETRYRNIFQTVGVSIWEEDFSQVKAAIDALKNRGVQDFRQYLRANPQFVQQAISMARIVDVNDVTLKLFAAESKADLLASLHKVFLPETQEVFAGELMAIAEGRTSFEAETVLRTLKGERLTVIFTMTFPPPPSGFESVLVSVTDITERKLAEAERARLGQRLRQAEKMEAVGRLAGGIAHDFNNILGGILGYAELLAEGTEPGSAHRRYAQNVLTAANRATGLVEQILYYSRSQRGKRVPVQLDRIVAETLELVRGSLRPVIQLEATLPATPLFVIGDPTQLHQVVMNLCTNAIQAMGEDGTLCVALEAADAGAERAVAHGTLQPGPYVRLTVEDTGPGMDEATIARIFEPFFTTKEVGKGTGLGLSLIYGIVTDAGGGIDVKSVPGCGSTFTIYLPRVDTAIEIADENQGPVPRGNGERVLVVDDEESLVAVTSEVLLRLGYEPVGFSDSHAALAAFESAPERFDAAITDEVMPQLTGTEFAALLRRRRADLPIVLVSGYIGPLLAERAHGAGVTEILKKPVQSREIAEALAHVLRGSAPSRMPFA